MNPLLVERDKTIVHIHVSADIKVCKHVFLVHVASVKLLSLLVWIS